MTWGWFWMNYSFWIGWVTSLWVAHWMVLYLSLASLYSIEFSATSFTQLQHRKNFGADYLDVREWYTMKFPAGTVSVNGISVAGFRRCLLWGDGTEGHAGYNWLSLLYKMSKSHFYFVLTGQIFVSPLWGYTYRHQFRSLFSSFSSFHSLRHSPLSLPHSRVFNIKVHCLTGVSKEQGGFCWIFLEPARDDKSLSTLVRPEREMRGKKETRMERGPSVEHKRDVSFSVWFRHRFETE